MYAVADFETSEWSSCTPKIEFKLGCMLVAKGTKIDRRSFKTAESFLNGMHMLYLENGKKPVRIYFHNLSFDIRFIMQKATGKAVFSNSKCIRYRTAHADFRDSLSLLLSSVESLGQSIGVPKLNMKIHNLEEYCFRDCEIVQKYLELLAKEFGMDVEELPLTLGSLMHKKFHDENKKYEITLNGKKINAITSYPTEPTPKYPKAYDYRKLYRGARCEAYSYAYHENVFIYDINSMYCHVQISSPFPIPPYVRLQNEKGVAPKDYLLDERFFGGMCIVEERHKYPFIPSIEEGRIVYKNGTKRAFLFREEIEYCLKKGWRLEVEEAHYCSEHAKIFSYLKEIYERRKNTSHESEKAILKACLVRSYGKFAEKQSEQESVLVSEPEPEAESELVKSGYSIAKGSKGYPLLYSKSEFKQKRINLVVAMKITAMAKLVQQEYLDMFEKKGTEVYYTDTDSFFVEDSSVQQSSEIGGLKLEKKADILVLGKKMYLSPNSQDRNKIKGLGKNGGFWEKAAFFGKGAPICRPCGIREGLRLGSLASVVSSEKKSRAMFCDREIFVDGSTLPLWLGVQQRMGKSKPIPPTDVPDDELAVWSSWKGTECDPNLL